jgi:tripartite-type tricarboxylate transporter receptor subunit TctC
MHHLDRRALLGAAAALPFARPALAAFPEQPVRITVPWNAGGLTDLAIRVLAPAMGTSLGQPVVIENRAGANGAVGTQAVARAAPDGHSLIVANAETHAINPLIYPRLPYDAERDFTPVTVFARAPFVLIRRPGLAADNLEALLAMARAAPGRITYASWGIGSTAHLAMELLARSAGVQLLHVPFTGSAPAGTALRGGQVDIMFITAGAGEAAARDGQVKILAAGSPSRIPLLPDVPTLAELGQQIEAGNWYGLLGPARMPDAAAARIAQVTAEALRVPANVERFRALATLPMETDPAAARAFIAADRARWEPLVRALNIRIE